MATVFVFVYIHPYLESTTVLSDNMIIGPHLMRYMQSHKQTIFTQRYAKVGQVPVDHDQPRNPFSEGEPFTDTISLLRVLIYEFTDVR